MTVRRCATLGPVFATLAGGLPRPPDAADDRAVLDAVLAAQVEAGLELLTDGRAIPAHDPYELIADGVAGLVRGELVADPGGGPTPVRAFTARSRPRWQHPLTVDAWRAASASPGADGRAVKQVLPGPVTLGRLADPGSIGRRGLTFALAEALNAEMRALAAAGCPVIQVDEPAAVHIGDDRTERRLWQDAQRVLTDGLEGTHLSLAVLGGSADAAGGTTIFEARYSSFVFDLIDGPDNWYLVRAAPTERGIVVGALDARPGRSEAIEILVWAGLYAASSNDRGPVRVGLATANSLAACDWDDASARIALLGRAARRAGDPNVAEPRGHRMDLVARYAENVARRSKRDRAAGAESERGSEPERGPEPESDARSDQPPVRNDEGPEVG